MTYLLLLVLCFPDAEIYKEPVINFWEYSTIRKVNHKSQTLADLESHIKAGHQYTSDNLVTWAHETTHGINSDLRNKTRKPSFYVLGGKVVVLEKSSKKLENVANIVPSLLRDHLYQLYLVDQQTGLGGGWNDEPYYILDEWVAYTNGAQLRVDLDMKEDASEVLFMMQFCTFSSYLCFIENKPDLIEFTKYNTIRAFNIYYRSSGDMSEVNKYLDYIRTDIRLESLRTNMKSTFGVRFCQDVWKF